MNNNKLVTTLGINLKQLEKDLRGLIYETIHEELKKFDIKKHIDDMVHKHLRKFMEKYGEMYAKRYTYKFLEESRIAIPEEYVDTGRSYERKITLNDFIIQIVREVITDRILTFIKDIEIEIKKEDLKNGS